MGEALSNPGNLKLGLEKAWTRIDTIYGSPEKIESSLKSKLSNFQKITHKDKLRFYELSDVLKELFPRYRINKSSSSMGEALVSYITSSMGEALISYITSSKLCHEYAKVCSGFCVFQYICWNQPSDTKTSRGYPEQMER
jgi:hypothetical protein